MSTINIVSGPEVGELLGRIREHEQVEFTILRDEKDETKKYLVKPLTFGEGVIEMEISRNVGGTLLTYAGYYNYVSKKGSLEFVATLSRI